MKIAAAAIGSEIAPSFKNANVVQIFEADEKNGMSLMTVLDYGDTPIDSQALSKALKRMDVAAILVGAMDGASRMPFMIEGIAIIAGMSGGALTAAIEFTENPGVGCDSGDCDSCESQGSCEHHHAES